VPNNILLNISMLSAWLDHRIRQSGKTSTGLSNEMMREKGIAMDNK